MSDDEYLQYDDAYLGSDICRVYSNEDSFTAFVQGLLAFVALMSLWFKRMREVPQRSFQTWFLDVSKQGVGAVYGHVANMIVSAMIVSNIRYLVSIMPSRINSFQQHFLISFQLTVCYLLLENNNGV